MGVGVLKVLFAHEECKSGCCELLAVASMVPTVALAVVVPAVESKSSRSGW